MHPELPSGTVTFLFTDIQGSTRLLQDLGDEYPAVQDEHATILRRAIEEGGGVVVRTEGDAFFAVFPTAVGAVRAASEAQRGLAAHRWSHGGELRVRMGLHTGEGVLGGDDYVGIDVNRAARIAAAGHGGQILVSGPTRALVDHALPEGTFLRDLGEHRLKDIEHPEHLHDLVIEGLLNDFPPIATLGGGPGSLPVQLTSFVGREEEIEEVGRLLEGARIITLTGPGGTGKSRLALQVAAERQGAFRDGVSFVDLSLVTDPALVPSTIARALGVPEAGGRPLLDTVKDALAGKQLLLIIDNFEQVADAAPGVEELVAGAPGLTVMVTSRVPLAVEGEQEYPVSPLDPPDPERLPDLAAFRGIESVRLFGERARAVVPRFEVTEENARAVAEITARLDGLPLAIELAASGTKVLSPEEIAARLDQRLAVGSTSRTVPERQRTLRGAIAWSYDLLEDPTRHLFVRLSAFTGGWTLDAAEAVCAPDELDLDLFGGLGALVDHSLVRRDQAPASTSRFSMMETIREFAREHLGASGDEDRILRRHVDFYLDLAVEAAPHLEREPAWLERCEREHDNLRAALRWAIDRGETDRAQEAAGALWRFWQLRGHLIEARSWFDEVLSAPPDGGPTAARASALAGAGGIAWWLGDVPAARARYEEALAVERELGDANRTAEALYNLAFPLSLLEGPEVSIQRIEESLELFRGVGNEAGVARALGMLSVGDTLTGNWGPVVDRTEAAVAIWRRIGDRVRLVNDLIALAFAYVHVDRLPEAKTAALEALDLAIEDGSPLELGGTVLAVALQASKQGRYEDALRLTAAAEVRRQELGSAGPPREILQVLLGNPAEHARAQLSPDEADRAWEEGWVMPGEAVIALARRLAEE